MTVENMNEEKKLLLVIRSIVAFFIVALVVSGATAFPVETELTILSNLLGIEHGVSPSNYSGMKFWIAEVYQALLDTNTKYPFLAYGYDWLAFAHLVIAVAFIGVYMKPVRNIWVVHFGMIACVGILPLAFICGSVRGIPFYWQLIDCSFGIFGIIPLYILHVYIKKLGKLINYIPQKY